MSKSNGTKAVSQFAGLLLCMLLMQTAFAAGNITADNIMTGNATNENTTIGNATNENTTIGNATNENSTTGNTTNENSATGNATANSINPPSYSTYLLAGGSTQFTVSFTNGGNETLTLIPKVVNTPDSQNNINASWITISPTNATVAPGSVQNFNIEINVPKNLEGGYYQGAIAFTGDLVPNSIQYVNSMQLGISVQAQPKIELQSSYISDNVEAGKEYEYQIKIKNVAENDITIDPTLNNYNPGYLQAIGNDAIEISAPSTIKAGEVTTMTIKVNAPENSTGYYNGYIDMNVDRKVNDGSTPQIGLYFNVWQQPVVPYVKTFSTKTNAPITIEVSTDKSDSSMGLRTSPKDKDPSFDLGLIHNSVPVNMTFVKSAESGSVNIGSNYPIWAMENGNIYQSSGSHYVETYTVPGAIGNWELTILPKNAVNFGYSITVGDTNPTITGNTTADNTTADNTTADNTTADNTTADNSTADNTTADNSTADNSTADNTTVGNTTADNTTVGNTTADNTTVGNTTADNATADNSTADNTTVGNTTADNTTADNSTADNTTVGDTTADNTTVGNTTADNTTTDAYKWNRNKNNWNNQLEQWDKQKKQWDKQKKDWNKKGKKGNDYKNWLKKYNGWMKKHSDWMNKYNGFMKQYNNHFNVKGR